MTTTRETADHFGEANEKVADHIGDATTMIDHAEMARLAEAKASWSLGIYKNREQADDAAKFNALDLPATVLSLLSEIATLRGERDTWKAMAENGAGGIIAHINRATQAERQRDKLRRELEFIKGFVTPDQGSSMTDIERVIFARISRVFANQGFDQ